MLSADDRLSLVGHLDELRKRLFRVAFVLLAGVIIAGIFNSVLFKLLLSPLPLRFRHLTTFSPAEPFMVSFKVWVYCGLLIASPFVIYQFWAFVAYSGSIRPLIPLHGGRPFRFISATCSA
jgi:sec-independent protein translocase protein TatC